MRGKELQAEIAKLAKKLGWRRASFPPVKTDRGWRVPVGGDSKGWPDVVLVRERMLVREIKGDGDRMRYEQQNEWQSAFAMAGVDCGVWTPADWNDGTIDRLLRMRMPNSLDLGWAAGMWEASGSTNERGELRVYDRSIQRADRLAKILGGKVYGPYGGSNGDRYITIVNPENAPSAATMLLRGVVAEEAREHLVTIAA